MGCDIHLYVEVRRDGAWISPENWIDEYGDGENVPYEEAYFNNRNYRLFSVLADVRNAEEGESDYLVPIAKPRGIPENADAKIMRQYEIEGGHSASHLTVAEIMNYDWTQNATIFGCIELPVYARWLRWGRSRGENPESWCKATSFGTIPQEEADRLINGCDADEEYIKIHYGRIYTETTWTQPYCKCAGRGFLDETLPRLWRLGDPEDVRIVFWFDN